MGRIEPPSPKRAARLMAAALAMGFGLLAAGCAEFPELATQKAAPGPAPVLVPLDGILAQADAVGAGSSAVASVDARADALRDRAERLRSQ